MMPAIPLLAHERPDAIVAWRGDRPVPAREFLGDVRSLAARLPPGGHVINLCADRYRFAVGLGAALCRGAVTLLPPGQAREPLRQLAAAHPGSRTLADPGAAIEGVHDVLTVDPEGFARGDEVPRIDPSQVAVVAFTSGSTGVPQPHPKTWGSLARGAQLEAQALGLACGRPLTVIGTVPPQHMYGLESTVLLPLCLGFALHAGRPLYPADVRDALARVPTGRVLVTTPVHLRALLAEEQPAPAVDLVVSATAPLSATLAARVEAWFGVPLREIYGFTEAGAVAVRRTAQEAAWRTLPEVRVRQDGGVVRFGGGHVEREVAAGDALDVVDEHSFVLHGRSGDLINVAGKRSSLAHLEHALAGVEGVLDCAFVMPEEDGAAMVTRPIAFAVAPGCTRDQLLQGLRERIDAVFLPRPLHLVDALPRNATGKLTREALRGLASAVSGKTRGEGVAVQPGDAVAQGHFPGNPVVPGAVILDAVLRHAEVVRRLGCSTWDVRSAKFAAPLRPGEAMRIELEPGAGGELAFTCYCAERRIASGVVRPHALPA